MMKQRIVEHLENHMPMARAIVGDGDYTCDYCDSVYLDNDIEDRPVFCPTCGCLLKWGDNKEE